MMFCLMHTLGRDAVADASLSSRKPGQKGIGRDQITDLTSLDLHSTTTTTLQLQHFNISLHDRIHHIHIYIYLLAGRAYHHHNLPPSSPLHLSLPAFPSPRRGDNACNMEDSLWAVHTTLSTSIISATPTATPFSQGAPVDHAQNFLAAADFIPIPHDPATLPPSQRDNTINGVVIGLLSSFGSAIFIALIFLLIYVLRYTSRGRILLDRIGRPGQYDDEQAFAREEAEALEEMDDIQRTEYLRAKGRFL